MAKCEQRPRRFVGQRQFWAEPATQCHLEKIWPATNSTMAAWPKTLLYTILNLDFWLNRVEGFSQGVDGNLLNIDKKKGSYPPIVNHPHHDGLDSLFYLSCFTREREWITRRALTLLLNILHSPIRHLIHCVAYTDIHRQIQRAISSLFYVFLTTIDHCFTISSMFYVFM